MAIGGYHHVMQAGPVLVQGVGLEEFARDPILTVACVLLVVVSIAWIVVSRMIVRNLKRAAADSAPRKQRRSARRVFDAPPD